MKISILAKMSIVILVILFASALRFDVANAVINTVYIRPDGSIDPPFAAISTADNITYTITADLHVQIVIERSNVVVDGAGHTLLRDGTGTGIGLTEVSNVTVKNVVIRELQYGIRLHESSGIRISDTYVRNSSYGVWIQNSSNSYIAECTIENNTFGVWIFASDNILSKNFIKNNTNYGIVLDLDSTNNTISMNNIMYNARGVWVILAFNNSFYNNNFIDNSEQVVFPIAGYPNYWNEDYPIGGNYWSDYAGTDSHSGPYQNETGSDGIGDTQYIIDPDNIDNFPLMSSWGLVQNLDAGLSYMTIQDAINAAETVNGHKIFVKEGTYYEHVIISKGISLEGENRSSTIIDGSNTGTVISVQANGASISSFTIRNGNQTLFGSGIAIYSNESLIFGNDITNSYYGVSAWNSVYHKIYANNITANTAYGIIMKKASNSTVYKNNVIANNRTGIYLWDSSKFNIISENTIREHDEDGIEFYETNETANFNTISENNITNNGAGIHFWLSSSNQVISNRILQNIYSGMTIHGGFNHSLIGNIVEENTNKGIYIQGSSNSTLRDNQLANNEHNLVVWGPEYTEFIHDIDTSNTVNGKPVYYWIEQKDKNIPLDAGHVALISCTNMTLRDLNLSNDQGFILVRTNNSRIENVTASNGIYGFYSTNSSSNIICDSVFSYSTYGIGQTYSSDNTIIRNTVLNNTYGIDLYESNSNLFYHNNFFNNTEQVYIDNSTNSWHNGLEGNYWDNYTGADMYMGPNQDMPGSDGIGDTNHMIDANNTDQYPLMGLFSDFNTTSGYHVQTVCNSSISDFQYNGTAIRFNAAGEDGSTGFCRIYIPAALMAPTYRVFINGTEVQSTILSCSNSTHNYLYFNYTHSTKDILIVPELSALLIAFLLVSITSLIVKAYRKKALFHFSFE